MQIILNKKTYTTSGVKAIKVREALIIYETTDLDNITSKKIDEMAEYVVSLYNNQFTRDEVYDGLLADNLVSTLMKNMSKVIAGVTDILDTFPEK